VRCTCDLCVYALCFCGCSQLRLYASLMLMRRAFRCVLCSLWCHVLLPGPGPQGQQPAVGRAYGASVAWDGLSSYARLGVLSVAAQCVGSMLLPPSSLPSSVPR
jgi:hypothetical protein